MRGMRYWRGVGLCGLALFSLGAAAQDGEPKWGPHIDFEAKPGSKRSLGEADLFLPLSQDARTLVFANLRARFDNNSSREGNLGLGVRRMLESGWNLGAYGYLDRRRSPDTAYYYNQATLGAEALGRDWDFRANGYLPQGTRVRELGTVPGVSSAAISGASILVTTTASITQEERALKGFDAEVGWRAPLFDSEAARQLRLYAGGYRFSDDTVTVEGPRVRAELAMDDLGWFGKGTGLFLGLEAQNDGARGHQNFLSLRLRIPLGKERDTARPLNAQERRMTAPVMRDVDIVTQGRTYVSTPAAVETVDASTPSAAVTVNGHAATLVNSSTTSGAALPGAVAAAGANSTVVLAGTFNTTATTTLQAGQTLMGTGNLTVTTPSGHTVTLAAPGATINSTIAVNDVATVNMANNATLTGMTIVRNDTVSSTPRTVNAIGVSGATLSNNTLYATGTNTNTYSVFIQNSSNITVSGNTITGERPNAIGIALYINNSSATVANNTLKGIGTTSYAAYLVANGGNTVTIQPGSTGNVFTGGTCGQVGLGTFTGSLSYTAGGVPGTCP